MFIEALIEALDQMATACVTAATTQAATVTTQQENEEALVSATNSQGAHEPGEVPSSTTQVPLTPTEPAPPSPVETNSSEAAAPQEAPPAPDPEPDPQPEAPPPWDEGGPNPEGHVIQGESSETPPPPAPGR